MTKVTFVRDPKTEPPDPNKPYVCFLVNGEETWLLLATDAGDGITDSDFDFPEPAEENRRR